MKLANVVEFTLTTVTLAVWAIACTAAFQATTSTPAGPNATEPVSVTASPQSAAASAPLVEASLSLPATRQAIADRI